MEETRVDKTRIFSHIGTHTHARIKYRTDGVYFLRFADDFIATTGYTSYILYFIFYVTCGAPVSMISRILSTQLLYNMYIYIFVCMYIIILYTPVPPPPLTIPTNFLTSPPSHSRLVPRQTSSRRS